MTYKLAELPEVIPFNSKINSIFKIFLNMKN